jgi:hypothetical protein
MSDSSSKPEKRNKSKESFTVDNTNTSIVEMPSVTKLLNRKSLTKINIAKDRGRPLLDLEDEPAELENLIPVQFSQNSSSPSSSESSTRKKVELINTLDFAADTGTPPTPDNYGTLELEKPSSETPPQFKAPESAVGKPAVRPATRKKKALYLWTKEILAEASDPFHRGVHYLIEHGAKSAALLIPIQGQTPAANAGSTAFVTAYAYVAQEQGELWRGLSLSEELVPDVWQAVSSTGFLEFDPKTAKRPGEDSHSFLRKAFNLNPQDWFMLVRCGSPQACTGILALVSSISLAPHVLMAFNSQAQAA